jgi:hypothetical protein
MKLKLTKSGTIVPVKKPSANYYNNFHLQFTG